MERRAKDRAEYDEAVRVILWIRDRAQERDRTGDHGSAASLCLAARTLEQHFLLPPEQPVPGGCTGGFIVRALDGYESGGQRP